MPVNRLHHILLCAAALAWLALAGPAMAQKAPAAPATAEELQDSSSLPFADTSSTDIRLFNQTISDKNKVKSLFFSQGEVTNIHLAINTYLKHSGRGGDLSFDEEEFLRRLGNVGKSATAPGVSGQDNRYFTYPQFFLDSIVYHSPKDWTIWLNGARVSHDTPEGSEVRVVFISKDKAGIEWKPTLMEKVMETWRQLPNDEVEVDAAAGTVLLTLRPNQTFSSYVMRVLEGRVLPVTVDTSAAQNSAAGLLPELLLPQAEGAAPAAVPPGKEAPQEGLGGLIDQYNHMQVSP